MGIWQVVEEEFSCEHPESEIRLKYDSLNRPQYFKQCLTCGQASSTAIKQSSIAGITKITTWDYTLADSWQYSKKQKRDSLYQQHQNKQSEFWIQYNAYLQSPEWRMKRLKVLERDNYLCQACLEAQANQAHHKTYEHVFNEPLFDLVAVCEDCHNMLHPK